MVHQKSIQDRGCLRRCGWLWGWFLVCSLAAGWTTAQAAPLKRSLNWAVLSDPGSIDPLRAYSNEDAILCFLVYETLVTLDNQRNLIPCLAESLPTISKDARAFTFRLRKGVLFSNGRELTAEDVAYTFERAMDPTMEGGFASYFGNIQGRKAFEAARKQESEIIAKQPQRLGERWIEPTRLSGVRVLDRYTIEITLDAPDLAFLKILTTSTAGIVPKAEAIKAGRHFATHPVGTGPYVLERWDRGARIQYRRNPHYRNSPPGAPTGLDVQIGIDTATQAMMFENGDLDLQLYISDADYVRIQKTPELWTAVRRLEGTSPIFAFLNCEMPPFTNRLVRQALNYAIDKSTLPRLLANRCTASKGPLPEVVRGYNPESIAYPYDLQKARQLFNEAGLTNGFTMTLWVNRDNQAWVRLGLILQESLRPLGVEIQFKEVSYPALVSAAAMRGTVGMAMYDWLCAIEDPKEMLDSLFNGDNIQDTGSSNVSFYKNPEVQALFQKALPESNVEHRAALFRSITARIIDDAPVILLVHGNTELRGQPWLKGLHPTGLWPPVHIEHLQLED